MHIEQFSRALFDILDDASFGDQIGEGKAKRAKWFAWLTVAVAKQLRPNDQIKIWEYEPIAEAMQEAVIGHAKKEEPPPIEFIRCDD
jgi:hypothetical protein